MGALTEMFVGDDVFWIVFQPMPLAIQITGLPLLHLNPYARPDRIFTGDPLQLLPTGRRYGTLARFQGLAHQIVEPAV